jgi:serine/threonine-protein kinase
LSLTSVNAGLEIGSVVAGKFRIERILAEGGMGLVAAATHLQLEQTVALKFFRGDVVTTGESHLRFMREAKAAAQLKSEHVARVLDVGVTVGGASYIVMEYLEGQGLERVIADEKWLDPSRACEYAIQACEALSEAHARGIIHRDVKPSNLFLAERAPGWRAIKVLDFGVSKVLLAQASNITTDLNVVMGTPCYMSPEQLQSSAGVDHRTDIWSLGATLYQMLTGKAPFDPALPILALAEEIANKQIPAVHALRPAVPQALSDVVARCLLRDREQRIASAADLAAELAPFASARARLVAERAATLALAFGAVSGFEEGRTMRSITPSTPSPLVAEPEQESAQGPVPEPLEGRAAGSLATSVAESAAESAGQSLAESVAESVAELVERPAEKSRVRADDATPVPDGGEATERAAPQPEAGDFEVPVFVENDPAASMVTPPAPVSTPIAFPRPTAPPRAILWPEVDGDAPSSLTVGLPPVDRDSVRAEGWLSPKGLAVLAAGSILLCVFAFLILPRLVHRPRTVAGLAPIAGPLTAPEAAAPAGSSELVVYASPASAQIVIDGRLVTGNPFRARLPRGGTHLVKAIAPGYRTGVEQAHMTSDVLINLSLEESQGASERRSLRRGLRARPPVVGSSRLAEGAPAQSPAPPTGSLVDPRGGRAPLHPIVTINPYDAR